MAKARTVRFTFDPFDATGVDLPEGADKKDVLEAGAEYLLEQVLGHVSKQASPVQGHGRFPSLSKDYAAKKKAAGHPAIPNLLFDGDLMDAVRTYAKGNKIVIEVTGEQGAKADGHCNLSGDSELPLRRFIPDEGEKFKPAILNGLARIIKTGGGL